MKRGSMQCRIPEDMREQLAADPFMQRCIFNGYECEGALQWNHAFTYGGKRQNILWGILPMCKHHHDKEAQFRYSINGVMRNRIIHFNATDDFKDKYPKSTLI
jgi:hypothetical protein